MNIYLLCQLLFNKFKSGNPSWRLHHSNLSSERAAIVGNRMPSEASHFMPPKCVFTLYDKYGFEMECFRHSQINCN